MASQKYTNQVLENFIFDCMEACEIKYMPSSEQLFQFDKDKYHALSRNGGIKHWRAYLLLQSRDEYEMMMRRKVRANGKYRRQSC